MENLPIDVTQLTAFAALLLFGYFVWKRQNEQIDKAEERRVESDKDSEREREAWLRALNIITADFKLSQNNISASLKAIVDSLSEHHNALETHEDTLRTHGKQSNVDHQAIIRRLAE